jgi:coiled-coil domain-containing protein 130
MQGFNMGRYVPPDVEGTISGNALNKKHALGARASKLRTEGILTVRFEMPFAVWCATCPRPTIIGQGVRFNAEKKKVGAYHSTSIWSFRMRHADCGGVIEVRTDPANAEYVVSEGGTRRDTGDDKYKDDSLVSSNIQGEILTGNEKDAMRKDAFARLEKTIEDRGVLIERSHRIAELEDVSYRAWDDPYAQNRRLRAAFRAGRKTREKEATGTEDLQERMSLGIDLVPATEEDARRAALVDFGVAAALDDGGFGTDENGVAKRTRKDPALIKPLFGSSSSSATSGSSSNTKNATSSKLDGVRPSNPKSVAEPKSSKKKQLKSEIKAAQTRKSLTSEIVGNTRASQDPFLITPSSERSVSRIQGIKRKRPSPDPQATPTKSHPRDEIEDHKMEKAQCLENKMSMSMSTASTSKPAALVEYDSD